MDNAAGQQAQQPEDNPYNAYKGTELWQHVEKAIVDLVANNDIIELTKRESIVGYICKQTQAVIADTHA